LILETGLIASYIFFCSNKCFILNPQNFIVMEMDFSSLLSQVTDFIQAEAKAETVVGKEFKLGEFSCVPILRVSMGFGTGGGGGKDSKQGGEGEGGGAGAGVNLEPLGFLVSKGDDIQFVGSKNSKGIAAAFEKMPELLEKYLDQKADKEAALDEAK
jgi:uncharacterized spore protein YtfJ